ncbi:MAG: hypothetical protein MJ134_07660 [Lachnospiraceae bacterium]|nr:hypothetical protein [Lachnospiraceae bacterium]
MKIEREVILKVKINENTELKQGDLVTFVANGSSHIGCFRGISKKGALEFEYTVGETKIKFNVMPRSIVEMEVVGNEMLAG